MRETALFGQTCNFSNVESGLFHRASPLEPRCCRVRPMTRPRPRATRLGLRHTPAYATPLPATTSRLVARMRTYARVVCASQSRPVEACPSLRPALLVAAEHLIYHSIDAIPSVPPRRVPLRARNVPTNNYQFRPWLLRAGQPVGRWPRPGRSQRGSRCVFRRAVLVLARGGVQRLRRRRPKPSQTLTLSLLKPLTLTLTLTLTPTP